MKVLLFGGTGMVGQGVLRECLLAAGVRLPLNIHSDELTRVRSLRTGGGALCCEIKN